MRLAVTCWLALNGLACSGHYADAMRGVHELARAGKDDEAYQALEAQTRGTGWDALLVSLDEGALLHRAGKWKESADALNRAIAIADERETVSISEELLGKAPFRMANHEKQALHALQALNYLALGNADEAVVEARLTDLRQTKLAGQTQQSRADERFILGNSVDETQRAFFEQLVFGRYISGLAWEVQGDAEAAFIDYHAAFELGRAAPLDARTRPAELAPRLLRLARHLERPELDAISRETPGVAAEPPLGAAGELVVVVESGFGPWVTAPDAPSDDLQARAIRLSRTERSTAPGFVVANGRAWVPQTVSSLEELALRRRFAGVLLDRERGASIGINTLLFVSYFLLPPIAAGLLIKRAWESTIRMLQSWQMLPAEFQVARIRLPPGRHTVEVPTLHGLEAREVDIRAGRLTVLVTAGP